MVGSCALANGRICAGDESAVGVCDAAEKTAVRDEKAAGRAEGAADAGVSSSAAEKAAGRDEPAAGAGKAAGRGEQAAVEEGIADAGANSSAAEEAAGQDEPAAGAEKGIADAGANSSAAEEAAGQDEPADADDVGAAGRSGEVGETMTLQLNHVQHHYQTSVEYLAPMELHYPVRYLVL